MPAGYPNESRTFGFAVIGVAPLGKPLPKGLIANQGPEATIAPRAQFARLRSDCVQAVWPLTSLSCICFEYFFLRLEAVWIFFMTSMGLSGLLLKL